MKRLMITVFAMTTLSLGVGCGKKSSDPAAQLKGFVDQICACKGKEECIDKVGEAMNKWEEDLEKAGKKPTAEQKKKMEDEEQRMLSCMGVGEE